MPVQNYPGRNVALMAITENTLWLDVGYYGNALIIVTFKCYLLKWIHCPNFDFVVNIRRIFIRIEN